MDTPTHENGPPHAMALQLTEKILVSLVFSLSFVPLFYFFFLCLLFMPFVLKMESEAHAHGEGE